MNAAKKYLSEYGRLRLKIARLKYEVEEIRSEAESLSAWTDGDRVQSSMQPDKLGAVVARLVDKENEILDAVIVCTDRMNEIDRMLDQMEDPKLALILELRYKRGYLWDEVASAMHFDRRWVLRLHGRALEEINRMINRP